MAVMPARSASSRSGSTSAIPSSRISIDAPSSSGTYAASVVSVSGAYLSDFLKMPPRCL